MAKYAVEPTNKERHFEDSTFIVSKTDLKGIILYANDIFLDIAGYEEKEILGQPHSILRHPDMPRCIFKLLWDYLSEEKEVFAYVKNMCKNGDYYWVFAHATPSYDENNKLVGYHSSRRVSDRKALEIIEPLYAELLKIENTTSNRKEGMEKSYQALLNICKEKGMEYHELLFSITS